MLIIFTKTTRSLFWWSLLLSMSMVLSPETNRVSGQLSQKVTTGKKRW